MEKINGTIGLFPTKQPDVSSIQTASQDKEKLKEACKQFESIFINYLLKTMRSTVPDGGMFKKGVAYDIVLSMHDQALAEEISLKGGIGLAQQLYEELSKYV